MKRNFFAPHPAAMAGWLLALAFAAPLHAAQFCVHNGVELQAALNIAATNNADDNIKLAPGTFTPPADYFVFISNDLHGLTIGGGFATAPGALPCSTSLGGAQWSVLDGALGMHVEGTSAAPIFLHDLTIANVVSATTDPALQILGANEWSGNVTLENVTMRANHTAGAIALIGAQGLIIVRSSAWIGNTSTAPDGIVLALVSGSPGSGANIIFNNNTVAGNSVPVSSIRAGVLIGGGSGEVHIANNIVWNNGGTDLNLESTGSVYLDHNDIGSRADGGVVFIETNPYHLDPAFVAVGDAHLRADSLLRDAGNNAVLGGSGTRDAGGGQRVVFGTVDIGAYELQDAVFTDGFDVAVDQP